MRFRLVRWVWRAECVVKGLRIRRWERSRRIAKGSCDGGKVKGGQEYSWLSDQRMNLESGGGLRERRVQRAEKRE